ncbi:MAG: site-specific integrase, partial [Chloroflexi bacterium]|nr:site-specific integrase [Chloroflexota bacterium]
QNNLAEASERSGVQVTPHILRHTYAYMLRRNGIQPEVRARLMGHSIEMALRYGSPKEEELNKAVQSLDGETSF